MKHMILIAALVAAGCGPNWKPYYQMTPAEQAAFDAKWAPVAQAIYDSQSVKTTCISTGGSYSIGSSYTSHNGITTCRSYRGW